MDLDQVFAALDVLGHLGFVVETDWPPTRGEVAAPGPQWGLTVPCLTVPC